MQLAELLLGALLGGGAIAFFLYKKGSLPWVGKGDAEVQDASVDVDNTPQEMSEKTKTRMKESTRSHKSWIELLRKLFVLMLLVCFSEQLDAVNREKELNKYFDTMDKYVEAVDDEFIALRSNQRKDTKAEVKSVKDDVIKVDVSIPVNKPTLDGKEITNYQFDIKRSIEVTPKIGTYYNRYGFQFIPDITIGGSLAVDKDISRNIMVGFESMSYHFEYFKVALTPWLGTRTMGIGITLGSKLFVRNLRMIIGVGKAYEGNTPAALEVGVASAIGL